MVCCNCSYCLVADGRFGDAAARLLYLWFLAWLFCGLLPVDFLLGSSIWVLLAERWQCLLCFAVGLPYGYMFWFVLMTSVACWWLAVYGW